jgi:hypothetical protein
MTGEHITSNVRYLLSNQIMKGVMSSALGTQGIEGIQTEFWYEILNKIRRLNGLDVDWMIILKCILNVMLRKRGLA